MPRRDYSKVAFAATGDTNVIPTPTQPDGSISLQTGWGFDYQRDNGAGGGTPDPLAKNIDREDMNGILNEITASLGEVQQNGYPIWVATGAPYPINATVRQPSDNKNYRSTITNNNDTPGGVGVTTWVDADAAPPLHGLQRFTASGSFTVPAGVTQIFASGCAGGGGGGAGSGGAGVGHVGSGGGGGGAGQSINRVPFTVTPGQVIAITIGGNGVGGGIDPGGGSGNPGTAGGNTVIGALATLTGGGNGLGGLNATSGAAAGAVGGSGFPVGGIGSDATSGNASAGGGIGASSPFGGGGPPGRGGATPAATPGQIAGGFGAGGGGGGGSYAPGSGSGGTGGPGSAGLVIIEW